MRGYAWRDRLTSTEPALLSSLNLWAEFTALIQVLIIDIVLAGDNAIVVGLAVNGLPPERRRKAIFLGIGAATGLRILFALVTLQLLAIIGLLFAGGLLLLWVCWKMYRELSRSRGEHATATAAPKTMRAAMFQILLADLSMSLDNVLAVAGAAREHPWVLVVGLGISVVLMGAAASLVARLLDRFPWLAWIGLAIVLYIAVKMIWEGGQDIFEAVT
jgi:YjbE family integral membrane protein